MNESKFTKLILARLAYSPYYMMRNNSGAMRNPTGRLVRYGLGHISAKSQSLYKSADLIGIRKIRITPEMVGTVLGQFVALEIKVPGWKYRGTAREAAQKRFLDLVQDQGGVGRFISGLRELEELL